MSPMRSKTSLPSAMMKSTSCCVKSAAPSATSRACPFSKAIRQFAQDRPRGECVFMHLTLLPWIGAAGELKTKPTQHSGQGVALDRYRARRFGLPIRQADPGKRARKNRSVLQRPQGRRHCGTRPEIHLRSAAGLSSRRAGSGCAGRFPHCTRARTKSVCLGRRR